MVGKIVVAGDVTIDWLKWSRTKIEGDDSHNWELYNGFEMVARKGGALLLANMVYAATGIKTITHQMTYPIADVPPRKIIQSLSFLDQYPGPNKSKVFRVKEFYGFSGPSLTDPMFIPLEEDSSKAELILLDDAGNGFRDQQSNWKELFESNQENPYVILKMARPLGKGELWKKVREKYSDRLIVIVNANELRDQGVNISRRLSWERTALDFMWQIKNNPDISQLRKCKNLIVRLGSEGVIHYQNNGETPKMTLYYDPMVDEDGYNDKYQGNMQGFGSTFTAAVAAQIVKDDGFKDIGEGIKKGIESCRKLFQYGFGIVGLKNSKPHYPGKIIFSTYKGDIASIRIKDDKSWSILGCNPRWQIESMVKSIVEDGPHTMFSSVPVAHFGGLVTVDRTEIEGYHSIRNLMKEYLNNEQTKRPLSISVFGPPGSGKSFGVTQLALSLDPDRVKKLEFNVSQFTNTNDLVVALHKVRDTVLNGKIPLVFFDEFDSEFNGELGWLKYFLAPMQDGEFKEGDTVHPIGKCIFVFAGGTSDTLNLFSRKEFDPEMTDEEIKDSKLKFRLAKGTDFVSRLRGYINILGPNPYADDDDFYMVRRALFLRSILERNVKNIFDKKKALIDPGVMSAFIKIPRYRHGVRSMEAIIDMSMLSGRNKYEQSVLPSEKQLEMHVNSELFTRLVVQDALFGDAVEKIAIQIHEKYREDQKNIKKSDDPAMRPWEDLSEVYKESNRGQARDIPNKLDKTHYDFEPVLEPVDELISFSEDEVEFMAIMEHDRWWKEKEAAGYHYGPERSDKLMTSPYMVHWNDLDEETRNWDRNAVRNIPQVLDKAGFRMYSLD